jgi:hypothetical protein
VYLIPPEEETRMPAQKLASAFDKVKGMLGGTSST